MRKLVALTAFLTTALTLAATASAQVVYVPHDKVEAVWTKGGDVAPDKPGLVVHVTNRAKPAPVEGHAKTTHIWYITSGAATFIAGGTVVGKKETGANFSGTDLQGGTAHRLTKGDVIIVPAGTPHWWKEVPSSITYYAVNVELAAPAGTK